MTATEIKKYIYENNKISFILEGIGCGHIDYHSRKDYYSCSNCDGDNKTAINIKNNEYLNCKNYTRKSGFDKKSDILTLVQYNKSLHNKNFTFRDTLIYVHKKLNIGFTLKKESEEKAAVDPLYIFKKVKRGRNKNNVLDFNIIEEEQLNDFVPYIHINWYREGIMPWTVKKFGLAYSFKNKRVVIPLRYWLTGELLGFNMRTTVENFELFDIKKYFITPNYPKQMNLFGLWENYESIKNAGYVVIVESEKSVLKRDSLLDETCVAVSGHEISDEQARILIGLDVEIIICLDNDIEVNYIRMVCEKFYHIRKISYITDRWDLLSNKDSPVDSKSDVYSLMFKFRTLYDHNEHQKYMKENK